MKLKLEMETQEPEISKSQTFLGLNESPLLLDDLLAPGQSSPSSINLDENPSYKGLVKSWGLMSTSPSFSELDC